FTFNGGNRDAQLLVQATNSGTYMVVVDSYRLNASRTYSLTLAKAPKTIVTSAGDEGGTLTNGVANAGTISLGDLDMWSFNATAGDTLVLRMCLIYFTPELRLFSLPTRRSSDLFTFNGGNRDAQLFAQATNSGIYT